MTFVEAQTSSEVIRRMGTVDRRMPGSGAKLPAGWWIVPALVSGATLWVKLITSFF